MLLAHDTGGPIGLGAVAGSRAVCGGYTRPTGRLNQTDLWLRQSRWPGVASSAAGGRLPGLRQSSSTFSSFEIRKCRCSRGGVAGCLSCQSSAGGVATSHGWYASSQLGLPVGGPRSRSRPETRDDMSGMTQRPSDATPRRHPRTLGWIGTTALAMGGSNQSLFLLGALVASQGSAAVPLLIVGLLLSYAAAFGWTELVLMFPDRVGGIAASCAEAFRPYSPVLSALTGVCYWWGWVPTCGLTAFLSASAITQWYLPDVPVPPLAVGLVLVFTLVNLAGVRQVTRLAVPMAFASAGLALVSGLAPVFAGTVDWQLASSFHLVSPFSGLFGDVTSAMAGLYLIGFAAPAFEAAACHVGETVDPERNVPRAMLASAAMAAGYFVLLPVVWLGVLGPESLQEDLTQVLGPTFAPVFGSSARAAAIGFMMLNMFHGTLQPLAGASRTLMQLAEDGLLPRLLALRSRADVPWVATFLTALPAIAFLLAGDPTWLIAAANLAYLVGIGLPSVAVWLLRRDAPHLLRPYRAPRGTIELGLLAAAAWGLSCLLGFQQFGLPTVILGLMLCYSGAGLYALRRLFDRRRAGLPGLKASLHLKLTGAMLLVMALDGAGYLLAVDHVDREQVALVAALEDIFVAVALLTVSVGLVLPGMIAHAAEEVARAADHLATGTLADLVRAIQALGVGDLDAAHARVDVVPVIVHTHDELGAMAASFNIMQDNVAAAAVALDGAREGLRLARTDLEVTHTTLQASEERNRLALRAANMGTWDVDFVSNVRTWSVETEALFGLAPGAFGGTFAAFRSLVHPDDWPAVEIENTAAQLEHRASTTTYRTVWTDGSVHWLEEKCRPQYAADGTLSRMTGTSMDITERKRSEEALRASEERFRQQYKGIPLPTYSWCYVGDDFVLQDYNDAAEAVTDGRVRDWLRSQASNYYADQPEILAELRLCMTEQRTVRRETRYQYATGPERQLAITC